MNSLEVKKLSYSYKNFEALKDVSFKVNDGLVGVLGPNGAGKTTLMKILTTLFSIQKGQVLLNGLDYNKDLKEIRNNLGYLPQDFETYGNITGREFLEIIATLKFSYNKKKIKNVIDELVEKMDMEDYINKRIKEYSGGMKQKLGFTQVLIGDPNLIIVDEPTVGLDPEQRNIIRELFPKISKNKIVLTTTHIVEDIEFYCNYLLVIKKGQLIYSGTKEGFIKIAEGVIWEVEGNEEILNKEILKGKILSTMSNEGKFKFRYINKEPLTKDSINIKPNLQDAYIAYGSIVNKDV